MNMDTDSSYKALSGNLHDVIKLELRREFFEGYGDWFVAPYCDTHREEFIERMTVGDRQWEMAPCCREAKRYNSRTPGKFKEEFSGSAMVALNSKTYVCCKDEEQLNEEFPTPVEDSVELSRERLLRRNAAKQKNSCKGLSKRTNSFTIKHYLDVLKTERPVAGVNKGFVKKNNKLYTYSQRKNGLTYFYGKRRVLDDGVSTTHLDI